MSIRGWISSTSSFSDDNQFGFPSSPESSRGAGGDNLFSVEFYLSGSCRYDFGFLEVECECTDTGIGDGDGDGG